MGKLKGKSRETVYYGILSGLGVLVAVLFFQLGIHKKYGEVLFLESSAADPSFTLFSLLPRNTHVIDETGVLLIDNNAHIVHRWSPPRSSLAVALTMNDHLLALHLSNGLEFGVRGECDELAEYDWNGKKVRSWSGFVFSHDFELLPNGHIAAISIEKINPLIKVKLKQKWNSFKSDLNDRFVELDQDGRVIWDWRVVDHLEEITSAPWSFSDLELSHANSIRFIADNPINHRSAYLVSLALLNRVVLIDIASKSVLWVSPEGLFTYQHDASPLSNGDFLVFDNGLGHDNSRVLEIDPRSNKTIWTFSGVGDLHFTVQKMGSAQRLENGNTLISMPYTGQIFEVKPEGEIVWNYLLPFRSHIQTIQKENYWQGHEIFRARKVRLSQH